LRRLEIRKESRRGYAEAREIRPAHIPDRNRNQTRTYQKERAYRLACNH